VEEHLRTKLKTLSPSELSYKDFEADGMFGPRHQMQYNSYEDLCYDLRDGTFEFSIEPRAADKIFMLTNTKLSIIVVNIVLAIAFLWPLVMIGFAFWLRDWRYTVTVLGSFGVLLAGAYNKGRFGCSCWSVLLFSVIYLEPPWNGVIPSLFVPFLLAYFGKSMLHRAAKLGALESDVLLQGLLEDGDLILKHSGTGLVFVPSHK
jgi:hypothetical protein